MDEIGAKTKKLRAKQDEKDLDGIIHRFQGVAEENCKTHQTVPAKRKKDRVRSRKDLGGLYVWK
jgi:hypothetical protein